MLEPWEAAVEEGGMVVVVLEGLLSLGRLLWSGASQAAHFAGELPRGRMGVRSYNVNPQPITPASSAFATLELVGRMRRRMCLRSV